MKKNGFMEGAIIATIAIIISKVLGVLYVIPFYKIIGEQGAHGDFSVYRGTTLQYVDYRHYAHRFLSFIDLGW